MLKRGDVVARAGEVLFVWALEPGGQVAWLRDDGPSRLIRSVASDLQRIDDQSVDWVAWCVN